MTFEEAMIELVHATDGAGVPVNLYRGDWTAESLRIATREFMRVGIDEAHVWLSSGFMLDGDSEAAYWENLAKLAIATSAAVREGR